MSEKRKRFKKRWLLQYGLPALVAILLIIRLLLPGIITDYLNKKLENIDPYSGSIQDVDLHLYRGAYVIKEAVIYKIDGEVDQPFIEIPKIDLSVEWKSLFRGSLVGEIFFSDPNFNFVYSDDVDEEQLGTEADWTEVVKGLMPIRINRVTAYNSRIDFTYIDQDFEHTSKFYFSEIGATNIRNVEDPDVTFPSKVVAQGTGLSDSSRLELTAHADFLKTVPNFDYNLSLEGLKLTSANPWFDYFTGMDFEGGNINIYSEMKVINGEVDGYFKPILKDAKIFAMVEEGRTFWQGVKELITEGTQEVLENRKLNTSATKIPIQGKIENPEVKFWPVFVGFLKNAYWEAFMTQLDHSIGLQE